MGRSLDVRFPAHSCLDLTAPTFFFFFGLLRLLSLLCVCECLPADRAHFKRFTALKAKGP